jgi:hypothetical protein
MTSIDQDHATTSPITTKAKAPRRRWLIILVVLAGSAALFAANTWMESKGEDGAPVWNCYTMGNHQCGPDSPWHGFYFGPTT